MTACVTAGLDVVFITVTSDFYADLGRYYRTLTDAFLEQRAREDAR